MIEPGIKGQQSMMVTSDNTAKALKSGSLEVFGTPAMMALMEETAWKSIDSYLEEGDVTVGTSMTLTHDAPTPVGVLVRAESILRSYHDRKFVFEITVYDEFGQIGTGVHERFLVHEKRFLDKANLKLDEGSI